MKALKFNTALLILTFFALTVSAQKEKDKIAEKEIHKEFQASQKTVLDLNNKFGDIRIKDWDQNEIKIDVKVSVYNCNPEKAQKNLDKISISFSEKENVIYAKTEIGENSESSFFETVSKNCSFQIDYEVSIPRYLMMNIKNKFGNIHINEIHGKTNIDLGFGDLRANNMIFESSQEISKVEVEYGNVSIGTCTWVDFDLGFSDLKVDKATALTIKAKYSDIEIDQAEVVKADLSFGDFKTENINKMDIYASYTDVKLGRVKSELMADLQFGDFHLKNAAKGFKTITIAGQYADIKVGFDKGASYTLSARASYGDVTVPNNTVAIEEREFSKKANGIVGGSPGSSTLTITSGFGDVTIYYAE